MLPSLVKLQDFIGPTSFIVFQNKSLREFLAQSGHMRIQHGFRFKMEHLQNALHND